MALPGLPHRRITRLLDSEQNWEWFRGQLSANGGGGFTGPAGATGPTLADTGFLAQAKWRSQ